MRSRSGPKMFCAVMLTAAMMTVLPLRAADLYVTPSSAAQDSLMLSARPGEYYYNLGADAVRHKDYPHAVEMYQVAASWAYKTAEFNLGVIYARGEGVAVDMPRAMAWMTLAAERNDKQYVEARNLIAMQLDKQGLAQAERILQELLPSYGDAVALPRAKLRWREVRDSATGSHLGAENGPVSVGNLNQRYIPTPGKQGNSSPTPMDSGRDITGTTGIDGTIAYRELRSTDNPYDPHLQQGVATVGEPTTVGESKPGQKNNGDSPRNDEQGKQ